MFFPKIELSVQIGDLNAVKVKDGKNFVSWFCQIFDQLTSDSSCSNH